MERGSATASTSGEWGLGTWSAGAQRAPCLTAPPAQCDGRRGALEYLLLT